MFDLENFSLLLDQLDELRLLLAHLTVLVEGFSCLSHLTDRLLALPQYLISVGRFEALQLELDRAQLALV